MCTQCKISAIYVLYNQVIHFNRSVKYSNEIRIFHHKCTNYHMNTTIMMSGWVSMTRNCHEVTPFDVATLSGCDQLIDQFPTHACGVTLDFLMTDVPDLVRVAVVALLSKSDDSSLSALISMVQAF